MNALAQVNAAGAVDLIDVFHLRAWARALLWREGYLDLHAAVDALQAAADRAGINTNMAQMIMAAEFGGLS